MNEDLPHLVDGEHAEGGSYLLVFSSTVPGDNESSSNRVELGASPHHSRLAALRDTG